MGITSKLNILASSVLKTRSSQWNTKSSRFVFLFFTELWNQQGSNQRAELFEESNKKAGTRVVLNN